MPSNQLQKKKKQCSKIREFGNELEHAFHLNISRDQLKTIIRCYELSFFRHILQAMYIFVYEKNQSKKSFMWIDSIFEARNICFEPKQD